ncbi:dihydrolipoyl dehydrogenase [Fusarium phyllophilum]|uniref:Dihydrolipoyl dehydrogenase n=1 Tax=Fusarium phyllophilum TaxID=47803 RepID=A0A8H5NIQ6_9HYPO|nr:dihydrolipoyl dehydrogenase [Fusarium phyllophilum]
MEGSVRNKKKRRASSRPNARTGCTACKCEEYGAFCEYQLPRPQDAVSKVKGRTKDLVPIQPRHPLQLIPSPSDSLFCDEAEARYFRIFHEKLAFDLSGYFEAPFWTRLIPQQCHHNPGIKHAILALSALYKSALSSRDHTVNLKDEHYSFALVQQRQAIISLRNDLSSGQPQMRLALVASLLFSCFESFHGDWETATQQVYNGFNILKRLSEDGRQQATDSLADIDLDVGLTLRRLELQILSFLAMTPMMEHSNDLDFEEVVLDLPDQCTTFNEAFTAVIKLAVSILRHAKISAQCEDDSGCHRDFLARQNQHLQGLMEQWAKAYEPMFLEACQNTVGREYLGVLQVRICAWKCEILIATSMSGTEVVYDDFTAQFQRMTHFARYVLQKDQELRDSDGPRLQYGMGLIMALFFTATRCRNFFGRREAIAILREWPCTNGIWHSLQAAKVAEWIVSIEEEHCSGLESQPQVSTMTRAMLPLILTTTNSILPKTSCEMEGARVISGFKRVAWPELRRLPLITSAGKLPAGVEQVRQDIEREAVSITKKHGLQFEDEEEQSSPQMEMRGVSEKPSTGLPTILIFAPWPTEKQRDWEAAAQEMAIFLADLSRVCSFSGTDIHVEIMAPELVQRTYYTNIDDPVFQKQLKATSHASLQKYGTNYLLENNPPTVYISVSHDSDETQWHEVVTEVKKTLDAAGWSDVQVHIEHNEGMVGYFDNFTSPTREQMNRGYRLKKRIEDEYYSTVHIGDDFGAARYIKRTDGERLSPTNGTIGCFVQLKTCDPDPTWRTFILTSYQAVRPAFDGFTVAPNGTDSSVAPPIANSDLWTLDSAGYTPNSSAKPTAFESPSRSKHHFNIHDIDDHVAVLTKHIQYLEKKDWPTKEKQLQEFRGRIAALRDERKQKTDFFGANKQALGRLYAASRFRRRLVGRRMDWALIEFDRPWHGRLPEREEWKSHLSRVSEMPYMTFGMKLEEQTRSIEALSGLAWSSRTFSVYKIGTSSGPTAGSLLCTNNLVTIKDDQYMNPSPTEEMAFEPKRYTYASERGFCASGDSGSVVFDELGGIVGLMIGGHRNNNSYNHGYGYVTPIEYVFKDIKDLLKGHVLDIRIAEL